MRAKLKNLGFFALFLALIIGAMQISIYQKYAFEATWLLAKEKMQLASVYDLKKLGSICNSLKRFQCSTRVFEKVIEELPNDMDGLANLAIALTIRGDLKKAEPYFKAYFSAGGNGEQTLYWYDKVKSEFSPLRDREVASD